MPSTSTLTHSSPVPNHNLLSSSLSQRDRGLPCGSRTPPSSPCDWTEKWDGNVNRIRSTATYYGIISQYKLNEASTPPVPLVPSPATCEASPTFDFGFSEACSSRIPAISTAEDGNCNRSSSTGDENCGILLSLSHHNYVSASLQRPRDVKISMPGGVRMTDTIRKTTKVLPAAIARSSTGGFRHEVFDSSANVTDTTSRPAGPAKPPPCFPPVRKDSLPTCQTSTPPLQAPTRRALPVPLSPITGISSLPPSTPPSARGSCRSIDPLLSTPEVTTPTVATRVALHRLQEPISEFEDYDDEDEKGGLVMYLKRPLRTSKSQLLGTHKSERTERRKGSGIKKTLLTIVSCGCASRRR